MAKDKNQNNLYEDVIGHEIYAGLTADLTDKQRIDVNAAIQQFANLLQSGLIKSCEDITSLARDEVASDMVEDAIEKINSKTGNENA